MATAMPLRCALPSRGVCRTKSFRWLGRTIHRSGGATNASTSRTNVKPAAAADGAAKGSSNDEDADAVVLLVGFYEDEAEAMAELVGALAEELEVGQEISVARVIGEDLALSAETLLGIEAEGGREDSPSPPSPPSPMLALPPAARCVLLRGAAARELMPDLRLEMYDAGFSPAVFGTFTASHAHRPISHVAAAVIRAHERYWDLSGDPVERAAAAAAAAATDDDAGVSGVSGVSSPPDESALWAVSTAWEGEEGWKPGDVTVALSVAMDKAEVADPPFGEEQRARREEQEDNEGANGLGRTREDASNIVALDGVVVGRGRCRLTPGFRSRPHACFQLLTPEYDELLSNVAFNCNLRRYIVGDALRTALLDAITETEYPHGGAVQVDPGLTPS